MNTYISSKLGQFRFLIIALLLLIIIFSCENYSSQNKISNTEALIDSLEHYIALGTNEALTINERQEALKKISITAQKVKDDKLRLRHFTKIQWAYTTLEDSLQFRTVNKQASALALKLNDSLRLGFTYWDLGAFLDEIGVKDSAYYNFSQAQELFFGLNENKRAGHLSYEMARIQAAIKDYTGSEINTIKAIEYLKPLNENLMLFRCYNLLGIISKDLDEYERSFGYYELAENYLKKSNTTGYLEGQLANNIGVSYLENGDAPNAIIEFKRTIGTDSLYQQYPSLFARALNNLARTEYKANANTDALSLFMRSIKIRDSIGDKTGLAGGYFNLAEYYLFKKDSVKALETLLKSKDYAELSSNNIRLLQTLELLTQVDPENAAAYSQKYITLNDSLIHEENILRNKFARVRFETDQVVAENRILAREKQLWAGIAVSILLLFTAGYVIINQRIKNQKLKFQQAQQSSDEKIFSLMLSEKQKLKEGKKIEQKRISEELHDGILGKMLGARMVLTGLNKKAGEEAITIRADAISALKDVESEVRTISHELSHAAYKDMHNFIRSISDLLKNTCTAANINHTFNYDNEIAWDNLNGDIKINVYRIIQESLQNAIKHSQCINIAIDFAVKNDALQVIIHDDGIGFELTKNRKKGIGMLNLKSRINKLNGDWAIDSKIGEGTSVRLLIPITYFSKETHNFDSHNKIVKG